MPDKEKKPKYEGRHRHPKDIHASRRDPGDWQIYYDLEQSREDEEDKKKRKKW